MVTIFMVTILMVTILMWTIFMVTMLMVTILMATMGQNGSPGGVTRLIGFTAFVGILLPWVPASPVENTHRGARTHDHKVKGLALCRLS